MVPHFSMTRKEQVSALLIEGCESKEIAQKLGVSVQLVKHHLHKMYREYGINSGIKRVKLATLLYRESLRRSV
jgi:DNA-binding NarL/FixJ family response regulator